MATKIRLTRRGSKKRPYYWIVVADSRSPRDGAFIEKIGTYDPFARDGEKTKVDAERAEHWLRNGAQPSDRVAIFLDRLGLRKKTQRYNPQKAVPKTRAQERLEAAEEATSGPAPSVQSVAFDETEKAEARAMIEKLLSAA